jgi:hypothetical protein
MGKNKHNFSDRHISWKNVHHLENKTNWGTNAPANLKEIQIMTHNAIHNLFGNQNPIEMIMTVFEFWKSIFNKEYVKEQYELWAKYWNHIINKEVYKNKDWSNKWMTWTLANEI